MGSEDNISSTTGDLQVMNINAHQNQRVECFKCRKLGHYARDCRSGREYNNKTGQSYTKTSYGGNGNKPITKFSCYYCGKPNHYARECRSRLQKSNNQN